MKLATLQGVSLILFLYPPQSLMIQIGLNSLRILMGQSTSKESSNTKNKPKSRGNPRKKQGKVLNETRLRKSSFNLDKTVTNKARQARK